MLRMLFQLIGIHYANGNFGAIEAAVRGLFATVPNDFASLQLLGLAYATFAACALAILFMVCGGLPATHSMGAGHLKHAGRAPSHRQTR